MYLKFWLKTLFYRFYPFPTGHLNKYRDFNYVHDRDKHPVRRKHYGGGGWNKDRNGDFLYRDYETYNEYKIHQVQKFNEILKNSGGFNNKVIYQYRRRFYHRFQHLPKYLPKSANILCAGARQGTEVEVLHELGFKNAYGIDLNPGPENKFVQIGDFMHLNNQDSSLDLIYSNSIDHTYNLESFFMEHARVIKPKGFVLYDFSINRKGKSPFEAVKWKSSTSLIHIMLKYFKSVIKVETEPRWKWILLHGKKKN